MNKKTSILIILFLILFILFFQASITTWKGYLFRDDWEVFSTTTGYSESYNGDDDNIWINETRYFSNCYISYLVYSKDGFLVGNNINLNISQGFVKFYTEGIPDENNITMRIFLEGFGEILRINASYTGNGRYEFNNCNFNKKIQYVVSGPKSLWVQAIFNDSNLTGLATLDYGGQIIVDIEPAYHTTQLKLTKSVIILTYWLMFFSIVTLSLKFCRTDDEKVKKGKKSDIKMLEVTAPRHE